MTDKRSDSEADEAALDKLIQRHASAYVARGNAISDDIIAECKASREALRAALLPGLAQQPSVALVDQIANIVSDYYDEDGAGRWRKCAEHIASSIPGPAYTGPKVSEADVIIVTARLRGLNALKEDYGQLQSERVRRALEASSLSSTSGEGGK